jgi:hypothetical protein
MTQVKPMTNPSVYCPWPTIQKDLGDSPNTPTQVSPHAANGNQPVAHLSEPCQCSPTHGLLRSKQLHVQLKSPVSFRNQLQRIDGSRHYVHTHDLSCCLDKV